MSVKTSFSQREMYGHQNSQARIFPAIMSVSPVLEVLGGFACIRLLQGMNPLVFSFIGMETLMVTLFTLTLFAGAGKISAQWLRDCKAGANMRCRSRKMLVSLKPLKVKFGQNFVDGLTPFVVQQFSTDQLVNLFLLV